MIKKYWHAANSIVYHDNEKCTEGNNIEKRNLRTGKGGRRLCSRCENLKSKN